MKKDGFTVFSIDSILSGDSPSDTRAASPRSPVVEVSRHDNHSPREAAARTRHLSQREGLGVSCSETGSLIAGALLESAALYQAFGEASSTRSPSPVTSVASSESCTSKEYDSDSLAPKRKKARTCFTDAQIDDMEMAYRSQRYLAASDRKQLARSLRLSDQQVKTWFQNRRMKEKRGVHNSGIHHGSPTPHVTSGMSLPGRPLTSLTSGLSPGYSAAGMTSHGGLSHCLASLSAAHSAVITSYGGLSQRSGSLSAAHSAVITSNGGLSQRCSSLSAAHPAMMTSPLGMHPLSVARATGPVMPQRSYFTPQTGHRQTGRPMVGR